MLYAAGMGTGFRASELASLYPANFNLLADRPVATVRAGHTKNRKEVAQPLPPDLSEALRGYLAGKRADQPAWPGTWHEKAAKMLRADLAAARTAWIAQAGDEEEHKKRQASAFLAYRDENGPVADFHSLRHSYITALAKSGVSPKLTQELARHSDIRLTMNRYTHAALHELAAAVDSLPPILPTKPVSEAAIATGTDGKPLRAADRALTKPMSLDAPRLTMPETEEGEMTPTCHSQKTQEILRFASDCERMITPETDYARRDSNPQPMVPKVDALGRRMSPQGLPGTKFTADSDNPKNAVTSHSLPYFRLFFNGFCTEFCTSVDL
jgi:hypothetical protein